MAEKRQTSAVSPESDPLQGFNLPLVQVPASKYFHVLVTEIRAPDHFYLQILNEDNANSLAVMSEDLNRHCSSVDTQLRFPKHGEICCGQFKADGSWYRALVNNITESGEVDVTFVDYGNEETLPLPGIQRILPQFLELPRQARKCSLSGLVSPFGNWPTATVEYLKTRILDKAFFAQIMESSDSELRVELFEISENNPGPSINEELLVKGLAQRGSSGLLAASIPQEDEFDAIVTEVQGRLRVWLQKLDREVLTAFSRLSEDLQEYCNTEAPLMDSAPCPGQFCCAQFSGDHTWYRAQVVSCNDVNSVTAQFIDYGNSEVLSLTHLRKMSSQFFELPCLAVECYLAGLKPVDTGRVGEWLRLLVDRPMKVKVLKREAQRIGIELIDNNVSDGQDPVVISNELVNQGLALRI